MPRTPPKSSPHLTIELDHPQPTYFPGDTITGYVTCDNVPVGIAATHYSLSSSVRLKLFGRAKSKYIVRSTNGTSIKRGRAVFFEEQQILCKDSTACDNGQHAWPFSVTIPTTSMPGFKTRRNCDTWAADHPFLRTRDAEKREIDVTQHRLPSIMYYKSESAVSGRTVEAFVEYVLVAESGTTSTTAATYPLYVRQKSTASPDRHRPLLGASL